VPASFPDDFQQALCAGIVACRELPDVATCMTLKRRDRHDLLELIAGVDAGRLRFVPAQIPLCLESLRTSSCDVLADPMAPCLAAFVGRVRRGGACRSDLECTGTDWCNTHECIEPCCRGSCAQEDVRGTGILAPIGGDCTTDACVAGAFCSTENGDTVHICRAKLPVGAACATIDSCQDGLRCGTTCYAPAATGQPCEPANGVLACRREDEYCHPASRTCTARGGVGDACPTLSSEACVAYALCDPNTQRCTAEPAIGQVCDAICMGGADEAECTHVGGVCMLKNLGPVCD